jgi:hypothetical protein
MKLFDLEKCETIDNILFEIMLEGKTNAPMREQLTTAIKILGDCREYPILRSVDGTIKDEDYNIGLERLYESLRIVLNREFNSK